MSAENPFSKISSQYSQWRPKYPPALYQHLSALCASRHRAWDCATGNGQAAVDLAEHFATVEATDLSSEQISHATPSDRVRYSVQPAEQTTFPDAHFDLVTVAQALHWFDHAKFWEEVHRVLKPRGVFAAWGYVWPRVTPELDSIVQSELLDVIRPYWSVKNQIVWDGYRKLEWPFEELPAPAIDLSCNWSCAQFLSFVRTWSATSRCTEQSGELFFTKFARQLEDAWGAPYTKRVKMHFHLRLGRRKS